MKGFRRTAYFRNRYAQRIAKNERLQKEFIASLEAFREDRTSVGDHALEGIMHGKRAFWINGEYRVIYREKGEYFLLQDVGTHEQVYK